MVSSEIVDDQNKSTKTNAPNAVALIFLGIIIYVYISSIFSILFWVTKPVVIKVDVFLCVVTAMILFLVCSRFAFDLDHDSARRLNFTIFSALVPALISTLYFSVSEIDDREYMNLESRIVSAGDDGKMVARSILKPHKKVNWMRLNPTNPRWKIVEEKFKNMKMRSPVYSRRSTTIDC